MTTDRFVFRSFRLDRAFWVYVRSNPSIRQHTDRFAQYGRQHNYRLFSFQTSLPFHPPSIAVHPSPLRTTSPLFCFIVFISFPFIFSPFSFHHFFFLLSPSFHSPNCNFFLSPCDAHLPHSICVDRFIPFTPSPAFLSPPHDPIFSTTPVFVVTVN